MVIEHDFSFGTSVLFLLKRTFWGHRKWLADDVKSRFTFRRRQSNECISFALVVFSWMCLKRADKRNLSTLKVSSATKRGSTRS